MENEKKKGFWDFACEHPIATFFLVDVLVCGVCQVVTTLKGHKKE